MGFLYKYGMNPIFCFGRGDPRSTTLPQCLRQRVSWAIDQVG